MLYPRSKEPELSPELFKNPTSEYRGAPFWAWNCTLDEKELLRQIDVLSEMGFGGFHMHVRAGMATPYLSDEFMNLIASCVDRAKAKKMLAWLYDEDRWPSGFAGGIVTKDPANRMLHLLFTTREMTGDPDEERITNFSDSINIDTSVIGELLGRYDVELNENGTLRAYRRLAEGETPRGTVWYAYKQPSNPSPRYNGQTYVDTLKKSAIDRFIDVTYEAYRRRVGGEFGKTVPAIFTDEPQFGVKQAFEFATSEKDLMLPWTDGLGNTYKDACGEDLLRDLPELFWERADGLPSTVRYHFHDHICDRFSEAFADNCGAWCREHGLLLTGHMHSEPTLRSQTAHIGEAMRAYRAFGIPGVDMLADRREYTTCKQTQSAVHQYGREGMMSELYGVTTWDFDFRRHKLQGDWQAALGVTLRVPHLAWVSMEGEAKRDYPASINYQSPWYREYRYIEDHFARVNTAMTRGKPVVRVAVIHPIETYWLHWGPAEQTALARAQLDENFEHITEWLLFGSIDFDFICESLFPELCEKGGAPLKVGEMAYDAVIVPACETLRASTLERLEDFRRAGGKLIFMGDAPKYENARPSARPAALYEASKRISFTREAVLNALAAFRTVEFRKASGALSDNLLYQMRADGETRWLFIAMGKLPYNHDISERNGFEFRVRGAYRAEVYDTLDGTVREISTVQRGGETCVSADLYIHDSLLLRLTPYVGDVSVPDAERSTEEEMPALPCRADFVLDEPNPLILDQAEYALDGEPFRGTEELLRADSAIRKELSYPLWGSASCQPWCLDAGKPTHRVRLRFTFESEIAVSDAKLAAELDAEAAITLDGAPVANAPDGFYVDHAIHTFPLPPFGKGTHVLTLDLPYGPRKALEWCYLLGNFGVFTAGRYAVIVDLPQKLAFGEITRQYLPFYSGKLTYRLPVDTKAGTLRVRVPQFRAAAVTVSVDGGESKQVSLSPYAAEFPVAAGAHTVEIALYVNRTNGFNTLHNCDRAYAYQSPRAWRTSGDSWSYEYCLKEEGLLTAPQLTFRA